MSMLCLQFILLPPSGQKKIQDSIFYCYINMIDWNLSCVTKPSSDE